MAGPFAQDVKDWHEPLPRFVPREPRVLLATDESDAARAAEEWLRRLRWAGTPAIDVLTIAPRPGLLAGLGLQTYRTAVREAVIQARGTELLEAQRIANAVGSRLQQAGMPVRVWACTGDAADEIVRMARLENADLVVVGRSGHMSATFPWGRTVASQVARDSNAAVLVAQPPARHGDRLPRSIAVLDLDDSATADALKWLTDIGWLLDVAGDGPSETSGLVMLASNRDQSVDAVRALVQKREVDLAVIPRTRDRDVTSIAMRIADAARVSVLHVPAMVRSH
jgi:nucleotide-binding universal stress UspA family protein